MSPQPDPRPAALVLQAASRLKPTLALILGSGLIPPEKFLVRADVRFDQLPGFANPRITGHAGRALIGNFEGTPLLILSGRAHFYEGYSMQEITFPVRVLSEYGISTLILTNAAGAIHPGYHPGDFMCFTDHINFMGENPLRGWCRASEGFLDLSEVYDSGLRRTLAMAAKEAGLRWHEGIYLAVSGPSYETPAEIAAFRGLGAGAVGMSTVPEAIVARHCGLKVAGVSCLTNLAAGQAVEPLTHRAVLRAGRAVQRQFEDLLSHFIRLHGDKTCMAAGGKKARIRVTTSRSN